jgi:hypothetical protein
LFESGRAALEGWGISKTCNVDLSEVTASIWLDGEIDIEKIDAWSTPRLNSAMRAPLLIPNTRINVPCDERQPLWLRENWRAMLTVSLAVAIISPSGLISMALKGDVCAGMIRTAPVSSSTRCTWPGVRPGNASNCDDKQQRPRGLSAVSEIEIFSGGEEKIYTWTLFCSTTTIRCLVSRTRRTAVRNSRVITAFCFASSHIITWSSQLT